MNDLLRIYLLFLFYYVSVGVCWKIVIPINDSPPGWTSQEAKKIRAYVEVTGMVQREAAKFLREYPFSEPEELYLGRISDRENFIKLHFDDVADVFSGSNVYTIPGRGIDRNNVINIFKGVEEPSRGTYAITGRMRKAIRIHLFPKFFNGFSESADDLMSAVLATVTADAYKLEAGFIPEFGPTSGPITLVHEIHHAEPITGSDLKDGGPNGHVRRPPEIAALPPDEKQKDPEAFAIYAWIVANVPDRVIASVGKSTGPSTRKSQESSARSGPPMSALTQPDPKKGSGGNFFQGSFAGYFGFVPTGSKKSLPPLGSTGGYAVSTRGRGTPFLGSRTQRQTSQLTRSRSSSYQQPSPPSLWRQQSQAPPPPGGVVRTASTSRQQSQHFHPPPLPNRHDPLGYVPSPNHYAPPQGFPPTFSRDSRPGSPPHFQLQSDAAPAVSRPAKLQKSKRVRRPSSPEPFIPPLRRRDVFSLRRVSAKKSRNRSHARSKPIARRQHRIPLHIQV